MRYFISFLFLFSNGLLFSQNNDFHLGKYKSSTHNINNSTRLWEHLTFKDSTFRWQSSLIGIDAQTTVIEGHFEVISDTLLQLKPQKHSWYPVNNYIDGIGTDTIKSTSNLKIRGYRNSKELIEVESVFLTSFSKEKMRLKPTYYISVKNSLVILKNELSQFEKSLNE